MKIRDIMTAEAATATPRDTLNHAAKQMWEHDCGVIPILDPDSGQLRAVLTDRDICMAAYTTGQPLANIQIESVMTPNPATCGPDDDVRKATEQMGELQIRRLPVCDADNRLVGLLSLNDLAIAADRSNDKGLRQEIAMTLAAICRHREAASAR